MESGFGGILSLTCFGLLSGIPAVICGHIARSEIRKSEGRLEGEGMALAGLITGYIGIFFVTVALLGMMAAISIPQFAAYREKAACSMVEAEAQNAAIAVIEYLSQAEMDSSVPSLEELNDKTGYMPNEGVKIRINGSAHEIKIYATDKKGMCSQGKTYVRTIPESESDGWREN
jgi:Tfp pilus assembly major pilin PilA